MTVLNLTVDEFAKGNLVMFGLLLSVGFTLGILATAIYSNLMKNRK